MALCQVETENLTRVVKLACAQGVRALVYTVVQHRAGCNARDFPVLAGMAGESHRSTRRLPGRVVLSLLQLSAVQGEKEEAGERVLVCVWSASSLHGPSGMG